MTERYEAVNGWVALRGEPLYRTLLPENAQKAADELNGLLDRLAEAEAVIATVLAACDDMERIANESAARQVSFVALIIRECVSTVRAAASGQEG